MVGPGAVSGFFSLSIVSAAQKKPILAAVQGVYVRNNLWGQKLETRRVR